MCERGRGEAMEQVGGGGRRRWDELQCLPGACIPKLVRRTRCLRRNPPRELLVEREQGDKRNQSLGDDE